MERIPPQRVVGYHIIKDKDIKTVGPQMLNSAIEFALPTHMSKKWKWMLFLNAEIFQSDNCVPKTSIKNYNNATSTDKCEN